MREYILTPNYQTNRQQPQQFKLLRLCKKRRKVNRLVGLLSLLSDELGIFNDELEIIVENKELLSLAAKALNGEAWHPLTHTTLWNPIDDDGQALQLGVELGMDISQMVQGVKVAECLGIDGDDSFMVYEKYSDHKYDKLAATRLAIVKCAAEIFKGSDA